MYEYPAKPRTVPEALHVEAASLRHCLHRLEGPEEHTHLASAKMCCLILSDELRSIPMLMAQGT